MALSSAFQERLELIEKTRIQRLSLLQVWIMLYSVAFSLFSNLLEQKVLSIVVLPFMPTGRAGSATEQVQDLGIEAFKHQIHGKKVLVSRAEDRFAEFRNLTSQIANRGPGVGTQR